MDFIKNFTPTPLNVLKAIGVVFVGLFIIIFAFNLLGSTFGPIVPMNSISISPRAPVFSYAGVSSYNPGSQEVSYKGGDVMLSSRNVAPTMPVSYGGGGVGADAENFEVTDYSAAIETRNKLKDCGEILKFKSLDYVVFENNNESETYCSYSFKVKHVNVEEIISKIKALNPKDFSENTYTIKKQVDDFTSEIELLEKKIASINKTMESALRAYDEITSLATKTQDAGSLAKIIDSKIQIIQRLTDEGINANAQLERLTRAKAEQLDKVEYTYFNVSVYENKYIDWKNIKESWKSAIRNFFYNINKALQDATVNVLVFVFTLIPYLIYLSILLFVAKYSWRVAKYIWQR